MRPYLRGTVGMALDWEDTGGSQFFITHSPQPHLDGRYTVFGHVVDGMDVVDRLAPWDVIRERAIWDGRDAAAAAGVQAIKKKGTHKSCTSPFMAKPAEVISSSPPSSCRL